MIEKQRSEPQELRYMRVLNLRIKLSSKDANYYSFLEKGYEGEKKFDSMLETLSEEMIIVNDLLLECKKKLFQIDSMVIFCDTISIFDIKNQEGDYYIDNGKWYTSSGSEIDNPLLQKVRCDTLLRRLLHDLGYNFPIESNLVFVNPEFYLYQAPRNLPIIFPSQLSRLMKKLNMKAGRLKEQNFDLAKKLISLHSPKSPFTHIPEYSYEQLEKGVSSGCCKDSFMGAHNLVSLACKECGCTESVESAVLRNVEEFILLFPARKVTTKAIFEWCGGEVSEKTIRRVLMKNFILKGKGRASYYEKE